MSKYELTKTLITGKNYQAPPVRGKRERIGPDFRILLGGTAALAGLAIKAGMLGGGADVPKHVNREFGGEPPRALVSTAQDMIKVGEQMQEGKQVSVAKVGESTMSGPTPTGPITEATELVNSLDLNGIAPQNAQETHRGTESR